jgi:hypothetical protein
MNHAGVNAEQFGWLVAIEMVTAMLKTSVSKLRQISLPLFLNRAKYFPDEALRTRLAYLVLCQRPLAFPSVFPGFLFSCLSIESEYRNVTFTKYKSLQNALFIAFVRP